MLLWILRSFKRDFLKNLHWKLFILIIFTKDFKLCLVEDVNQLFNNSDSASNFANSDLLFSNAPVSEFPVSENVSCNITDNPIIEVPDSDFHLYCYSNCTRGRRYNQEMIQCIVYEMVP